MDNTLLGQAFREYFVAGLRRLIANQKLQLEGEWSWLHDRDQREAWLNDLQELDWNVFVEGPPHGKSDPANVLKYLARYLSGGPISNARIIADEDERVFFWARSRDKQNKSRPFKLRGTEFVRRWAMHCLPKGYTRSRSYGGYHARKRADYLRLCQDLLPPDTEDEAEQPSTVIPEGDVRLPKCPRCDVEMTWISHQSRPSWKTIFTRDVYCDPAIYSPLHHIDFSPRQATSSSRGPPPTAASVLP